MLLGFHQDSNCKYLQNSESHLECKLNQLSFHILLVVDRSGYLLGQVREFVSHRWSSFMACRAPGLFDAVNSSAECETSRLNRDLRSTHNFKETDPQAAALGFSS